MTSARDSQIRALFRAALERPAAERASFIADLSGGDDELRKSVELLLSQHGATDLGARAASAPAEPPAELPAGTLLAHYRIDGVLGRGGMGVVYRATDTKLNRPVAIKFLAASVADAEVRRRFRQEATTTSGLNHPHIVTVHDVGEHDGRQYIVSELVDGGTLEDWSAASRHRSWRQCVELVTGVADGLAAAHAAGVLHRDVKPGNILIGANGYAKLADFGLAKLVDSGAQGTDRASAGRTTRAGVVVGTVAYMSPEQTTGQPLDARSDVFSFGIVLYELLAGRRPFESANDLGVLKAIAHENPPPLPDTVPELLRMAVDKALEKEPADRYQTMQDLVADLRRVTRKSASSPAVTPASRRRTVRASTAAIAAVALFALGALARHWWPEPAPTPPLRFTIETEGPASGGVAVSPDGRYVAYSSGPTLERTQLYLRALGSLESRVLAGTRGAQVPFWSPDSTQVGFWSNDGWIKRVAIAEAGSPQNVVRTGVGGGGSWNEDGTIVFDAGSGLKRVSVSGGEAVQATNIEPDEGAHVFPHFLPDGRRFVFSAVFRKPGLYVQSLDSTSRAQVSNAPSQVAYAEGRLLFTRNTELFAQPFDVDRLQLTGEPTRVADDLFLPTTLPIGLFSASSGVIAYVRGNAANVLETAPTQLAWYDRGGQRLGVVGEPGPYRGLALSPDGKRIAVHRHEDVGDGGDIWTLDLERNTLTRLTFGPGHAFSPSWSPDGEVVLYTAGAINLYQKRSNGVDAEELVLDNVRFPLTSAYLPDGTTLLISYIGSDATTLDIGVVPLTGEKKGIPVPLASTPFLEGGPRPSPDGRWVAHMSNESGRPEVYVRPYPSASGRWQISTAGGTWPRWAPDGRALFYIAPDNTLMEVAVDAGERTFLPRTPRALFSARFASKHPNIVGELEDGPYDVAPDGQRFLINEFVDAAPTSAEPSDNVAAVSGTIAVIVNWASEL